MAERDRYPWVTQQRNDQAAARAQWFAENIRVEGDKFFKRQGDGWVETVPNDPIFQQIPGAPTRGSGSNFSFNFNAGDRGGGLGVNLPLFGTGGEMPGVRPGGATGPGGTTFRPGTPAVPIAGSSLPPINWNPNTALPSDQQGNPTPPADTSAPVSAATPGTTTPTTTTPQGGSTMDAILDWLKANGTKYGPAIAAGGKILTDLRTGRQVGRGLEQAAATTNNTTNTNRYLAELGSVGQDINQRNYLGENYDRNASNAIHGDYLQGVEDINIPRPAGVSSRNITGGLRPSAFPNRKAIGDAMEKEAMTELLDPTRMASDPRPATKRLPALPALPEKIDVAEPGAYDKVLEYLGLGASALPFIQELIKATTPKPATTTPTTPKAPTPSTITPPDPLTPTLPVLDPYSPIDSFEGRRRGRPGYDPYYNYPRL